MVMNRKSEFSLAISLLICRCKTIIHELHQSTLHPFIRRWQRAKQTKLLIFLTIVSQDTHYIQLLSDYPIEITFICDKLSQMNRIYVIEYMYTYNMCCESIHFLILFSVFDCINANIDQSTFSWEQWIHS